MTKKDKEWLYIKKAMQKQFDFIMGYRTAIRDIEDEKKIISYSTEKAIYLKKNNKYTESLSDSKSRAFMFGLFAREMAKISFTDTEYFDMLSKEIDPHEIGIFGLICSLTETPAIENCASTLISGHLLKCMKYVTKVIYDKEENIDTFEDGFEQYVHAMIHYGTMGLLKGKFTDLGAKRLFFLSLKPFYKLISSGNPRERLDLAMEIFEISRPLWEKHIDYTAETLEGLEGLEFPASSMYGSFPEGTKPEYVDDEEIADSADFSKGAMRKTTFEEIEKEEHEEEEEEKILTSEEEEEKEEEEEAKDPGHTAGNNSDSAKVSYTDEEIDLSTGKDFDIEEYEITKESLDSLERIIKTEVELDSVEIKPTEESEIPEFPEVTKKYGKREYQCKNAFVSVSNYSSAEFNYNRIVKKNLKNIENCYKRLKSIFAEEAEETEYRSSGKLSIEKVSSTTVTPKVFTKSVDPKDRSNMAVMLAIDESGSMSGTRIERAKEAAISIAEIFGKLGIPAYIMGFTADVYGADAYHRHYTTWENKKVDRSKLTTIMANANNFDGYSIRYASKLLSMRPEAHKVLLVISDGQPACRAYGGISGYSDTKDAIREARTSGQNVLGIAIGADVNVLQKMYGRDFIFITTGEDLFVGIMKKFTEMVRKW